MSNKQRQALLAYLGYYVDDIDGIWGTNSKIACKAFQEDFGGLSATGTCNTDTDKALKHAVCYGFDKKEEPSTTGDWWDEIEHFERKEFACKCGKCGGFPKEPEKDLLKAADRTRKHFNAPMTVTSGVRCKTHNANVGGVSNSRHLSGKAMDFCVKGKSSSQVLAFVQKQPEIRYAYAIDGTYVHMDIN